MGQAKQRGTYEQRKMKAKEYQEQIKRTQPERSQKSVKLAMLLGMLTASYVGSHQPIRGDI